MIVTAFFSPHRIKYACVRYGYVIPGIHLRQVVLSKQRSSLSGFRIECHTDYETRMRDAGSARVNIFLAYLMVGYLAMHPMVWMRKIYYIRCGGGGGRVAPLHHSRAK